ncbi:HTH-type transcriptional repressor KstR2 [compost metagenome]
MAPTSKRTNIIKAACQLVRDKGASQLTLEAVAKEAGVSKGGLLYHFPSKDALIKGIMDDLLDRFDLLTEEEASNNPELNNRWAQAYLLRTFMIEKEDLDFNVGFLAAAATNPDLLGPMRARYQIWQQRMEVECADPVEATVARLAGDGYFFCELFGLAPLDEQLKTRVMDYMLNMVKEGR